MKRLRHYNKGTAIVLCCFGSVNQQAKYSSLRDQLDAEFENADLFMALSSKSVLKKLADPEFKTLPEQLAALDRAGYQHICVISCYLFPTEEHQQLVNVVEGFRAFSLAKIEYTPAIIHQVKNANQILAALHQQFNCTENNYNLFIYHGAPNLDAAGYNSINYTQSLLTQLSSHNLVCSLEGGHPYGLIAQTLKQQLIKAEQVRLIPLLLVSGNHFEQDVAEIAEQLKQITHVTTAPAITGDRFCLIDVVEVKQTLIVQTRECLTKLGVVH